MSKVMEYLKKTYPALNFNLAEVTGFRTTTNNSKGYETTSYGEFLTIAKSGEFVSPFRDGFSIKNNSDHVDFEERVFKYVNERLKELGYV